MRISKEIVLTAILLFFSCFAMFTFRTQNVSAQEQVIGTMTPEEGEQVIETLAPGVTVQPTTKPTVDVNNICKIGSNYAKNANLTLTYNGKKIKQGKTPIIYYQGTYMIPFEPLLCKKGPKASVYYNASVKYVKITYENNVVTYYNGDTFLRANGKKKDLGCKTVKGKYVQTGKTYYFVPLRFLCKALGFEYSLNINTGEVALKGSPVSFSGQKVFTQYAYSRTAYAKKQKKAVGRVSYEKYLKYITVADDTTHGFKYLRVNQYREVDYDKFIDSYQTQIEDYCRQNKMSPSKSVLYGKGKLMLRAAKKYNLDPVFFVNQTFLESAYGTSWLASGNRISKVALKSFKRRANGKFVTKKIKKSVKVYNLYGIKAYDADPYVGATSYAYYQGWTTVSKAVYGAAKYLRSNYIHGSYQQNTIFKMRYTFRKQIWHQYATAPDYAESIGKRLFLMSSVYAKDANFVFDYPKYK